MEMIKSIYSRRPFSIIIMISLINNDLTDDVSEETFRKQILNFISSCVEVAYENYVLETWKLEEHH